MVQCPFCFKEYEDYGQHMKEEHSISCKEVKGKALAYAKGRLGEYDNDRIDFHLRVCKSCLRAAERIWKQSQEVTDGQSSVKI